MHASRSQLEFTRAVSRFMRGRGPVADDVNQNSTEKLYKAFSFNYLLMPQDWK